MCSNDRLVLDAQAQPAKVGPAPLTAGLGHDEVEFARAAAGRREVLPVADTVGVKVLSERLAHRGQIA